MRYRVKDYDIHHIASNWFAVQIKSIPVQLTGTDDEKKRFLTESLRLIIDETATEVYCSSMQKSRIDEISLSVPGHVCGIRFTAPEGKISNIENHQFTVEFDFGDTPADASKSADIVASFFNITEATEYTALTSAEAIAIARDCQYNVMGTDWPIPTWLPTGVTEAQVESAAEGLGIPYHEPTQTA